MLRTRVTTLLTAVFVLLTALLSTGTATAAAKPALDLPATSGPFPVGTTTLHLVDRARADPWAPTPGPRELMAQVWYPAVPVGQRAEYGDPAVSQHFADLATAIGMGQVEPWLDRVHPTARQAAELLRPQLLPGQPTLLRGWPLILQSHGRGTVRAATTAIAEDLAAKGYVVAAVDHTYDAAVTRFPDGRTVRANRTQNPTEPELAAEVQVRVADLRFTLDQLSAGDTPFRHRLDLRRVGVFGHSLGGDTAAEAMRADRRFRVGANLDGAFWGEAQHQGVPGPFALFSAGPGDHPSFTRWRANQRAWGRHFTLPEGIHSSATDLVLFPAVSGLRELLKDHPEVYKQIFGSLDGVRTTQLYRTYLGALFDRHLLGRPSPLLDRDSARWPEHRLLFSVG
ncbi:alpha/beta hydrolase family protein [Crossiella sp. CA198]|uniref:alpha/beta hydrolase family protein n=1 Tax=Crossiella sp. CA198 TaxID=3455607 RepID=UPI003F8D5416